MTAPTLISGAHLLGGGSTQRDAGALTPELMDQHHFIDCETEGYVVTGTLGSAPIYTLNWWFNQLMWTTTQNASIGWYVDVAGGYYTVDWYTATRSDMPRVQAKIDGVNIGILQDLYVNNFNINRFIHRTTGVFIARGRRLITLTCPSKNASSTAYIMVVSGLGLTRTGASL